MVAGIKGGYLYNIGYDDKMKETNVPRVPDTPPHHTTPHHVTTQHTAPMSHRPSFAACLSQSRIREPVKYTNEDVIEGLFSNGVVWYRVSTKLSAHPLCSVLAPWCMVRWWSQWCGGDSVNGGGGGGGDRVNVWVQGTVKKVNYSGLKAGNNTYNIVFDDGDKEKSMPGRFRPRHEPGSLCVIP